MNYIEKEIFNGYKLNIASLTKYEFLEKDGTFASNFDILDGNFTLEMKIKDSDISSKIIDKESGDEYKLHLLKQNLGEFALSVKNEYIKILTDIRDCCFTKEFTDLTDEVINEIEKKYHVRKEYLWEKYPTFFVYRREDNNKWFLLFVKIEENKIGMSESENLVPLIVIRCKKNEANNYIDKKTIFPAYHMNKSNWISIPLNHQVLNKGKIIELVDESYKIAFH